MQRVRALAVGAILVLSLLAVLLTASVADSASPNVVISQVYAGGGNAGAGFTNDFVELFNRGPAAVDVGSWTVQYAPASGTAWQATALKGSIPPGRFYLVALASTAAVGAVLPTPDASGTSNLAASGGKVALVRGTEDLTCGSAAGSCSSSPLVADLVGYGSAADFEGASPAPALDSATAAARAGGGCTDTDSSSADFTAAKPAPHNSAASVLKCPGTPAPGGDARRPWRRREPRRAARALDRARPAHAEFRQGPARQHAGVARRARDGRQQRRGRVLADRSPLRVRAR